MSVTQNGTLGTASFSAASTSGAKTFSLGGSNVTGAYLLLGIAFTTTTTTPETVTGVTDSEGNTWTLVHSEEAHAGWNTGQTINGAQKSFTLEVWECKNATCNSSIDITAAFSGTIDACSMVLSPKLVGAYTSAPLDANASLPKVGRINTSAAESITGISSDATNIYPVWLIGIWGVDLGLSNVTFNGVSRNDQDNIQKNASEPVKLQMAVGPAASGPYSNVTYASPTSCSNAFMIGLVVTSDAPAPSGPPVKLTNLVITQ